MTPRLRTLIDQVARSAEPDAVLLRRFAATRDPPAFAELVRRYGRLVWGQCRNLLQSEADADDAFQATFLTLAKAVRTVRDTNKLGPWLHGVAYRVCQQVKRTAARRTKREKATARREAARPVADSAWDTAFAAVHDELAKLPDTLRVPFVLCVLEGKGTTEAAEQLGVKLGTFSARLSRAKQTLFEQLNARGLTAGLAAVGAVAVGSSTAPAAVAAKACDLAAGGTVPANILSLSHGVLNMVMMNVKRWVVAAVLGCGLAAGVGGVMTANAQDKKPDPKPMPTADGRLKLLQDQAAFDAARAKEALEKAQADADQAAEALKRLQRDEENLRKKKEADQTDYRQLKDKLVEKAASPEFKYAWLEGDGLTTADFEKQVKGGEADGYTFVGVVNLAGRMINNPKLTSPALAFRRTAAHTAANHLGDATLLVARNRGANEAIARSLRDSREQQSDQEKQIQAEIDRLTKALTDLKAKEKGGTPVWLALNQVGGDSTTGSQFVTQLIRLRFGEKSAGGLSFDTQKDLLVVKGLSKEQATWLTDTVNGLAISKPQSK